MKKEKLKITDSSGNVFLDLGFPQSRVSDLIRGKFEKFSLDMLITLATRAGKKVELRLAA
ncbi:MAG: XRE family transcriptional regulator [Gallionella sp.]|nr:XRE family transcriptional regulator [Gallionella sp.]MDD4947878.1 XRE family transcriptional regulator [Gallionella sp.]